MTLFKRIWIVVAGASLLVACTAKFLKYDQEDQLRKNKEFEQAVKIVEAPVESSGGTSEPAKGPQVQPPLKMPTESASTKDVNAGKPVAEVPVINKSSIKVKPPLRAKDLPNAVVDKKSVAVKPAEPEPARREPDLEDMDGFAPGQRRPLKDPFRVGEKVVHDVSYFKVSAGQLTLEVGPFVEVNHRKSYNFITSIQSNRTFSTFYSVDDYSKTYVDYEELIPHVFTLHVKESGQLREASSYFDSSTLQAKFWEKKFTEKNGHEEKKLEWEILKYSQNVYSAAYYMRIFQWKVGKEHAFRIADDGENIIFRGKAIRAEKIKTEAGEFNALVIKPEIEVKGLFKPMGDIFFWLSDDDRKYLLRVESKIKIGTLVTEAVEINPGNL